MTKFTRVISVSVTPKFTGLQLCDIFKINVIKSQKASFTVRQISVLPETVSIQFLYPTVR